MSEQNNQPENGAAQPAQAQIQIQRVYLKDMSFESPTSPQSFSADWKPQINVELNSKARQINDTAYEVVLNMTVTTKAEDNAMYLAEIQQAGLFHIANVPEQAMGQVLGAFCPNVLFPYAREAIDNLVSRGGFSPLMLAPVNFEAIYAQKLAQQQAEAAKADNSDSVEPEKQAATTH